MSNPSQPRTSGADRPDALARNFSAQLKSDFNLEGDLPTLSSHLEEQKHAIVTQRQELHRLEAQLEETEEALAQAGIAPGLTSAMNTQDARHAQGFQPSGGQAGAAGFSNMSGGNDAQRMADDVYTEGDYQGDASIRRLGGEGFSMRDTQSSQQNIPSTYGVDYQKYQQPSGTQQEYNQSRSGSAHRGQSESDHHDSSHDTEPMSKRILAQSDDTPVSPKATGYQQFEFSRPIKGGISSSQHTGSSNTSVPHQQPSSRAETSPFNGISGGFDNAQGQQRLGNGGIVGQQQLGNGSTMGQPAFGSVHHQQIQTIPNNTESDTVVGITNYHVPADSVEVPYRPTGSF